MSQRVFQQTLTSCLVVPAFTRAFWQRKKHKMSVYCKMDNIPQIFLCGDSSKQYTVYVLFAGITTQKNYCKTIFLLILYNFCKNILEWFFSAKKWKLQILKFTIFTWIIIHCLCSTLLTRRLDRYYKNFAKKSRQNRYCIGNLQKS